MSTDDELFTRSEVLGGFSAKRARLLLFQIESRNYGSYFLRKSHEIEGNARKMHFHSLLCRAEASCLGHSFRK
jgi:hypothetical protein